MDGGLNEQAQLGRLTTARRRGRAKNVGAQLMPGDPERALDEKCELRRDRTTACNPLTDELRGSADGLCQSRLAAGFVYCFLDWGHVHAARVALLFVVRNSTATSFYGAPLLALLYG
jgi:hypothetical protein